LGKGKAYPSSPYIRSPLAGEFDTSGLRDVLEELSSPPHAPPLSHLSLMWLPKGYVGTRSAPLLHTVVLRDPGSDQKPIYFRNLGWIRQTGRSHHSPYMYK
jgi:hypothetical protein